MISNFQNTSQQMKQQKLSTCLPINIIKKSSSTLDYKDHSQSPLADTASTMSTLTAAGTNPLDKPPMEAVVVNSIIYSKPSFCRISVDLDEVPVDKKPISSTKLGNAPTNNNMECYGKANCTSSMDLRTSEINFDAASCFAGLATTSSLDLGEDARLYRMCTTMNGSIHHQISDLCDNILAMAGIFGAAANSENDDDNFIEFAYRDGDDDDETDDDEEDDFVDSEDYFDEEIDDDVVDFSYECLIEPAPKLNCDIKKKVRFNTKPIVHVMHTWKYAYCAARKGEWEMYARDRERFKLRIQRAALILNPILEREHRQKIYDKRFANLYNKNVGQNEVLLEIKSNKNSINLESKKAHQKKKRRKRRFCKMGNKHYF